MQRFKTLVGVLIVFAVFYLLWKILPPYIQNYQFQQEIQSIARNNEYSPLDENAIREQVKRKILDIGVPIRPENVAVQKNGSDVTIGANYVVHIDSLLHPFDMDFHPATKNGERIDPIPSSPAP